MSKVNTKISFRRSNFNWKRFKDPKNRIVSYSDGLWEIYSIKTNKTVLLKPYDKTAKELMIKKSRKGNIINEDNVDTFRLRFKKTSFINHVNSSNICISDIGALDYFINKLNLYY